MVGSCPTQCWRLQSVFGRQMAGSAGILPQSFSLWVIATWPWMCTTVLNPLCNPLFSLLPCSPSLELLEVSNPYVPFSEPIKFAHNQGLLLKGKIKPLPNNKTFPDLKKNGCSVNVVFSSCCVEGQLLSLIHLHAHPPLSAVKAKHAPRKLHHTRRGRALQRWIGDECMIRGVVGNFRKRKVTVYVIRHDLGVNLTGWKDLIAIVHHLEQPMTCGLECRW